MVQKYLCTFGFPQNFGMGTHPPVDIRVRTESTDPPWQIAVVSVTEQKMKAQSTWGHMALLFIFS